MEKRQHLSLPLATIERERGRDRHSRIGAWWGAGGMCRVVTTMVTVVVTTDVAA